MHCVGDKSFICLISLTLHPDISLFLENLVPYWWISRSSHNGHTAHSGWRRSSSWSPEGYLCHSRRVLSWISWPRSGSHWWDPKDCLCLWAFWSLWNHRWSIQDAVFNKDRMRSFLTVYENRAFFDMAFGTFNHHNKYDDDRNGEGYIIAVRPSL